MKDLTELDRQELEWLRSNAYSLATGTAPEQVKQEAKRLSLAAGEKENWIQPEQWFPLLSTVTEGMGWTPAKASLTERIFKENNGRRHLRLTVSGSVGAKFWLLEVDPVAKEHVVTDQHFAASEMAVTNLKEAIKWLRSLDE